MPSAPSRATSGSEKKRSVPTHGGIRADMPPCKKVAGHHGQNQRNGRGQLRGAPPIARGDQPQTRENAMCGTNGGGKQRQRFSARTVGKIPSRSMRWATLTKSTASCAGRTARDTSRSVGPTSPRAATSAPCASACSPPEGIRSQRPPAKSVSRSTAGGQCRCKEGRAGTACENGRGDASAIEFVARNAEFNYTRIRDGPLRSLRKRNLRTARLRVGPHCALFAAARLARRRPCSNVRAPANGNTSPSAAA